MIGSLGGVPRRDNANLTMIDTQFGNANYQLKRHSQAA